MIRQTITLARRMATRLTREPGVHVLNDIVLNQVLVRFDGDSARTADEATVDVITRVQADGTCWVGGATWFGDTGDADLDLELVDDRRGHRPFRRRDPGLLQDGVAASSVAPSICA